MKQHRKTSKKQSVVTKKNDLHTRGDAFITKRINQFLAENGQKSIDPEVLRFQNRRMLRVDW